MHQVTIGSVDFQQVEVDLDYADIQENLDFSDYVEHADLEDRIEENLPDMEEECTQQARVMLRSFTNAESPCDLGHEFIEAVQKAMTWQGDRFVEPAFTNQESQNTIQQEVRIALKRMFYDMETVVSNQLVKGR